MIVARFGYDLSPSLEDIRPTYRFDISCQGSVPQSLLAFLEATDFEGAIRKFSSTTGSTPGLGCRCKWLPRFGFGKFWLRPTEPQVERGRTTDPDPRVAAEGTYW